MDKPMNRIKEVLEERGYLIIQFIFTKNTYSCVYDNTGHDEGVKYKH